MPNPQAQLFVLLFVALKPVSARKLMDICELDASALSANLKQLATTVKSLGLELAEHNQAYQLTTAPQFAQLIAQLGTKSTDASEALSSASLEVLAIVAYRQPISRDQIDEIRGVGSEQTIKALLSRKLIVERAEKHDHQTTYGTTADFLRHIGLSHINKLPKLEHHAAR